MDQVVTTILFDGQFWIALIEKTDQDGVLSVGKYTFGAEPANTELAAFMLDRYALIPVYPSDIRIRVHARKSIREQERSTNKAKTAFKKSQKLYFEGVKASGSGGTVRSDEDAALRFALKQEKKKEKHRGH